MSTTTRRHLDSVAGVHHVPPELRTINPALLPPTRVIVRTRRPWLRRAALDAVAWALPVLVVLAIAAAIYALGYSMGHEAGMNSTTAPVRNGQ